MGFTPCFLLAPSGVAGSKGVKVPGQIRAVMVLTMTNNHWDTRPPPQAQLVPASTEGTDEAAAINTALSTTKRSEKREKS